MHDNLVAAFHTEGILEMIVIMAQDIKERRYTHWGVLILEMIATLYRNKTPESLLDAVKDRAFDKQRRAEVDKAALEAKAAGGAERGKPLKPKIDPNDPLFNALRKDQCQRAKTAKATLGTRHSRFTGAFRTDPEHGKGFRMTLLEEEKLPPRRRGGRKKPLMTPPKPAVNGDVAQILIDFCDNSLGHYFNPLLQVVGPDLIHNSPHIRVSDAQNFCEVAAMFCTLLCETKKLNEYHMGTISQILEQHNFTYLVTYCEEKSEVKMKQYHLVPAALKCIKALLGIVLRVTPESGMAHYRAAQRLLLQLTYDNRLLELVSTMAKDFDICNHNKNYLGDVVGTAHHLMKIIDGFSKSDRTVLVKKKGRKKKSDDAAGGDDDEAEEYGEEEDHHAETQLDASKAIEMFANPKTMTNYVEVFKDYAKNHPQVNHAIVKMWHRVVTVEEGRNEPVLYQLSTLREFHKLLADPYCQGEHARSDLKDLNVFCSAIVRRFLRKAVEHHCIFIEPVLAKGHNPNLNLNPNLNPNPNPR